MLAPPNPVSEVATPVYVVLVMRNDLPANSNQLSAELPQNQLNPAAINFITQSVPINQKQNTIMRDQKVSDNSVSEPTLSIDKKPKKKRVVN